ncbi:MAG: FAD-binding oxidoreductase [Vicinamibacterales bacterium]
MHAKRYWDQRNPQTRRRSFPAFRGDTTADVVVIGGGLTGCTAAWVFAQAGLDVVLVEAERLASGSTAAGMGVLVPEPGASYRDAEAAHGRRVARAAWQATRRASLEFASAIRRAGIRCDLAPAPLVINARTGDRAAELRREQAARRKAGLVTPWLVPAAVDAELGTDSAGALRAREAFVLDPVRATLAIAQKAKARGARIFERSPVRRTTFTRKEARVVLADGAIETSLVYVATGDPGRLFGQLRRHVRRQDAFAVVTEPLPTAMRRAVGRRAGVLTDDPADPRWLRWLPDGRAMFAGAAGAPLAPRARDKAVVRHTAELMYELSLRYPAISGLPAGFGWDLPLTSTADGLPWIGAHRNFPFHFFAIALGWHGESLAWHAARAALRAARGESRKEDEVLGFGR